MGQGQVVPWNCEAGSGESQLGRTSDSSPNCVI